MDFHCLYSIPQIDCKRCVVHSTVAYSNMINLSKDLMRYKFISNTTVLFGVVCKKLSECATNTHTLGFTGVSFDSESF